MREDDAGKDPARFRLDFGQPLRRMRVRTTRHGASRGRGFKDVLVHSPGTVRPRDVGTMSPFFYSDSRSVSATLLAGRELHVDDLPPRPCDGAVDVLSRCRIPGRVTSGWEDRSDLYLGDGFYLHASPTGVHRIVHWDEGRTKVVYRPRKEFLREDALDAIRTWMIHGILES